MRHLWSYQLFAGLLGHQIVETVINRNRSRADQPRRSFARGCYAHPEGSIAGLNQGGVTLFTVALIGADGAGKTTIARALEASSPLPVKYLYMGVSPLSSNHALPTTRLIAQVKRALGRDPDMAGPPDPSRARPLPSHPARRVLYEGRRLASLANKLAEQAYRQALAASYRRRGTIVVSDRDFFADYYAHDIASTAPNRPLASYLHGFILRRFYRRPDLLIFLDAPAEVLYARKGEGSVALIDSRRQEYLLLRDQVAHFVTVDAAQPYEEVLQQVVEIIVNHASGRSGFQRDDGPQSGADETVQPPLAPADG
jgi:thymidylate kinase